MKYRYFADGTMKLSTVGIGGSMLHHVSETEMINLLDSAAEMGINVIDLATDNIDVFPKVGNALAGRRNDFIVCVHLGLTFTEDGQYKRTRNVEEVKKGFEAQLAMLNTDYADIAYIHYVDEIDDYHTVFSSGMYEYAQQLKRQGRITKLGFGSHQVQVSRMLLENGDFDVFMFSINPAYDLDPVEHNPLEEDLHSLDALQVAQERADLYRFAEKSGVGITVMKSLGAGRLLKEETSPLKRALTVPQCIQYSLDRPAVLSCMIGVDTSDKLTELASWDAAPAEERDYSFISSMQFTEMKGTCVYCNHCLPCPAQIDIAGVHKFLDLSLIGDELARKHYFSLEHTASECIACGNCEKNCPFGVSVRDKMKKAVIHFGV